MASGPSRRRAFCHIKVPSHRHVNLARGGRVIFGVEPIAATTVLDTHNVMNQAPGGKRPHVDHVRIII